MKKKHESLVKELTEGVQAGTYPPVTVEHINELRDYRFALKHTGAQFERMFQESPGGRILEARRSVSFIERIIGRNGSVNSWHTFLGTTFHKETKKKKKKKKKTKKKEEEEDAEKPQERVHCKTGNFAMFMQDFETNELTV